MITLLGDGDLNERLYRGVRKAILGGRLTSGARVPSSRDLAASLGISRNVVVMAFDQLTAEGYLESRVGSGTYVADTLPESSLAPWRASPPVTGADASPRLSAYAGRVMGLAPYPPPGRPAHQRLTVDFRYGIPAVGDFPQRTWSRLVARRARRMSIRTLRYGRTLGLQRLRAAIAGYVTRARGVTATADQVVIVNGAQQALDLVARLFIDRGDRVAIEEPGYQAARQVFAAAGARLVPVPVDAQGMDVSQLPRRARVRLVYVTPSHQFPLGSVMPLARRLELLRWAEAQRRAHHRRRLRQRVPLRGPPGRSRAGARPQRPCLLRRHHGQGPVPIAADRLSRRPSIPSCRRSPPCVFSATITPRHSIRKCSADFIGEGHFERHLRRSRARNASRRAALLDAVDEHFGGAAQVSGENAGVHLVLWLKRMAPSRLPALLDAAAARGLGIYPVSPYYIKPPRRAGLLLGYACLTEREIRDGIALLARLARAAGRLPSLP